MIPIIEDYLNELLDSRFAYLQSNPGELSSILRTSQTRIDKLAAYLSNNKIKVVKSYPRNMADLPCVCIMLSAETETQEGLGDYGDVEDLDIRSFTETLTVVSNNAGHLAIPYVQVSNKPLSAVTSMTNLTAGTVVDESDYYVSAEGLGLIGITDASVEDGDQVEVTYDYIFSGRSGTQVLYEANYRLEAWAPNSDLTVNLYHLVKWALLTGRDSLVLDMGLVNQRLGGGDFEPAPSFFPEFVYRRAVTFWCQFTASAPTDADQYIQSVDVQQFETMIDISSSEV